MSETVALVGGDVLVSGQFVKANVLIEAGHISSIGGLRPDRGRSVDCSGCQIVSGLVDLQVNGGGGKMFSLDIDQESYEMVARAHAAVGTTALCPTIISGPSEDMLKAVGLAADMCEMEIHEGAAFVGIHVEGPFLAETKRGGHALEHLQKPSLSFAQDLLAAGRGHVRIVTVAPELPGALPVIEYLAGQGVHVSGGHTATDAATLRAAMASGLTGLTHLFNAMEPLTSRAPGPVGVALGSSLYTGVIGDLLHVSVDTLRATFNARPVAQTYLTTDAVGPLGADAQEFELYGTRVTVRDGGCYTADGVLAGTATPLSVMARNLVVVLGMSPEKAYTMASATPCRLLGLPDRGELRPGNVADVLVVKDSRLERVIVRGKFVETWPRYKYL
jgi:N-acetylglucosamine-6-phosphate deacetylase